MAEKEGEGTPTLEAMVAELVASLQEAHGYVEDLREHLGYEPNPEHLPGEDQLDGMEKLAGEIWAEFQANSIPLPDYDGHGAINLPIDVVSWQGGLCFTPRRNDIAPWCAIMEKAVDRTIGHASPCDALDHEAISEPTSDESSKDTSSCEVAEQESNEVTDQDADLILFKKKPWMLLFAGEYTVISDEQALYFEELIKAQGGYVSVPDMAKSHELLLGKRNQDLQQNLPEELIELIDSKPGGGVCLSSELSCLVRRKIPRR